MTTQLNDKQRGRAYSLVIFDMDGTLAYELLDFAAIRRDIGLPGEGGILEHIARMDAAAAARANDILDRHELAAAETCELHPGAVETLAGLRERGVATALLTRNSGRCAARILERHRLTLDFVATREHRPHKPHADSILNITRRFRVEPTQTLMVGDYLYDLEAAAASGADSALLCMKAVLPSFAPMATYRIGRLTDVLDLVTFDGGRTL